MDPSGSLGFIVASDDDAFSIGISATELKTTLFFSTSDSPKDPVYQNIKSRLREIPARLQPRISEFIDLKAILASDAEYTAELLNEIIRENFSEDQIEKFEILIPQP